jgi:hypothetical protein
MSLAIARSTFGANDMSGQGKRGKKNRKKWKYRDTRYCYLSSIRTISSRPVTAGVDGGR